MMPAEKIEANCTAFARGVDMLLAGDSSRVLS
jgi:hypothetical protein